MVPHPRLHFFVPGYAETKLRKSAAAVLAMTQSMFDNRNILINCNLANERFFTIAAIFRGKISPKVLVKPDQTSHGITSCPDFICIKKTSLTSVQRKIIMHQNQTHRHKYRER